MDYWSSWGIIRSVVSVLTLTWFIRSTLYFIIEILNTVVSIKIKVHLLRALEILADLRYPV